MLSEEIKREIEAECGRFKTNRSACIEAMQIIRRHRGWISDESISDLADLLEMTAEELDGVATFYNHLFRKPVGRHVILVCDSVCCWIMGYEQLMDHLKTSLVLRSDHRGRAIYRAPIQCLGLATRHRP
jgi:NADH-quinone oxidoreductase subunit E